MCGGVVGRSVLRSRGMMGQDLVFLVLCFWVSCIKLGYMLLFTCVCAVEWVLFFLSVLIFLVLVSSDFCCNLIIRAFCSISCVVLICSVCKSVSSSSIFSFTVAKREVLCTVVKCMSCLLVSMCVCT